MSDVKGGHFGVACTKYFLAMHPGVEEHDINSINHPNQYFDESQRILRGDKKEGKTGGNCIQISGCLNSGVHKTRFVYILAITKVLKIIHLAVDHRTTGYSTVLQQWMYSQIQ